MGGHDHAPYKVPDYSIYKVDDIPKLKAIKDRLAAKGLTDPWLRNEVWRYDRKHFPSPMENTRLFLFRGFGIGAGLCAATLLFGYLTKPKEAEHGDHH